MYEALFGYHVFGLGFVTSMAFIIGTGLPFSMPIFSLLCHVLCLQAARLTEIPVFELKAALHAVICWIGPAYLGGTVSAVACGLAIEPRWRRAGVLMSSWLGGLLLQVGEWIIRKLPLIKHIYSAAKQAPTRLLHPRRV